ncbi:O-antigen ligase family protein [Malaciobacter mytili]|uniref:O-antigen ligase family protein n=1 Tax=Malaciobacter mytili TaxID=603050 RepID=UPI003BB12997
MQYLIILVFLFAILIFVSYVVNVFYFTGEIKDLFEIVRYLLNIYLIFILLYLHKYYETLIKGFVVGVITSVLLGLLAPNNPSVDIGSFSIPQVFNPNVLGVLIGVSVFFIVLLELRRHDIKNLFLIFILVVLSGFTFSKASWLIVSFGLISYILVLFSNNNINKRYFALFIVILMSLLWYFGFISYLIDLIMWKLRATSFESSARDGGTFSARLGLILSGIYLFFDNPVLGIGISNFEYYHYQNETILGDKFFEDDNPNSAFIYILACGGILPFVVWCFIVLYSIYLVYKLFRLKYKVVFSMVQVFLFSFVILLSGFVQNEILNAYFFWFFIALLIINTNLKKVYVV